MRDTHHIFSCLFSISGPFSAAANPEAGRKALTLLWLGMGALVPSGKAHRSPVIMPTARPNPQQSSTLPEVLNRRQQLNQGRHRSQSKPWHRTHFGLQITVVISEYLPMRKDGHVDRARTEHQ